MNANSANSKFWARNANIIFLPAPLKKLLISSSWLDAMLKSTVQCFVKNFAKFEFDQNIDKTL